MAGKPRAILTTDLHHVERPKIQNDSNDQFPRSPKSKMNIEAQRILFQSQVFPDAGCFHHPTSQLLQLNGHIFNSSSWNGPVGSFHAACDLIWIPRDTATSGTSSKSCGPPNSQAHSEKAKIPNKPKASTCCASTTPTCGVFSDETSNLKLRCHLVTSGNYETLEIMELSWDKPSTGAGFRIHSTTVQFVCLSQSSACSWVGKMKGSNASHRKTNPCTAEIRDVFFQFGKGDLLLPIESRIGCKLGSRGCRLPWT